MEWHLTLLAVHVIAFLAVVALYRKAPCWMQRLVVVGLAIAFFVVSVAYAMALADSDWWLYVVALGLVIEHIAILLYVFRVVWQGALADHGHQRTAAAR